MAKPTQLPRWANGGTAVVTPEPSEGQKDTGWLVSQKPPRNYFNWWMLRVYQWCVYLDGLTNEALTWAAKHTFAAGLASGVAPSAATDVVRKTDMDALVDALRPYGFATWADLGTNVSLAAALSSTDLVAAIGAAGSWADFLYGGVVRGSAIGKLRSPYNGFIEGVVEASFYNPGATAMSVVLATNGGPAAQATLAPGGRASMTVSTMMSLASSDDFYPTYRTIESSGTIRVTNVRVLLKKP